MRTLCLTILFALPMLPLPARAHAILVDSDPPARAVVAAGPVAMTLHFNSRIDRTRSRLTLVAPDKSETRLSVGDGSPEDVMRASAKVTPGEWVVRWQVLATDGHITRGTLPFSARVP